MNSPLFSHAPWPRVVTISFFSAITFFLVGLSIFIFVHIYVEKIGPTQILTSQSCKPDISCHSICGFMLSVNGVNLIKWGIVEYVISSLTNNNLQSYLCQRMGTKKYMMCPSRQGKVFCVRYWVPLSVIFFNSHSFKMS